VRPRAIGEPAAIGPRKLQEQALRDAAREAPSTVHSVVLTTSRRCRGSALSK
jgi:hypothetical protein